MTRKESRASALWSLLMILKRMQLCGPNGQGFLWNRCITAVVRINSGPHGSKDDTF
jgi:hypothetical protein